MNDYYQKNLFKRAWEGLTNIFNKPFGKFDAQIGAIAFFVVLLLTLEYKVFESVFGMTNDIVLSGSVLAITAICGLYADVYMKRQKDATDDQILISEVIFYLSLVMSAFVGFGAWAQSAGLDTINFGVAVFTIGDFSSTVFIMATVVTVIDVLLFRAYFSLDVRQIHARKVSRSESQKTAAKLAMDDKLNKFDAQVKTKAEMILGVEAHKKKVRTSLQEMYGGNVPSDVMERAMATLDVIQKEIETGEDINGDGVVGTVKKMANSARNAFSSSRQPERAFQEQVDLVELDESEQIEEPIDSPI